MAKKNYERIMFVLYNKTGLLQHIFSRIDLVRRYHLEFRSLKLKTKFMECFFSRNIYRLLFVYSCNSISEGVFLLKKEEKKQKTFYNVFLFDVEKTAPGESKIAIKQIWNSKRRYSSFSTSFNWLIIKRNEQCQSTKWIILSWELTGLKDIP